MQNCENGAQDNGEKMHKKYSVSLEQNWLRILRMMVEVKAITLLSILLLSHSIKNLQG